MYELDEPQARNDMTALAKRAQKFIDSIDGVDFKTSESEAADMKIWCDDNGYTMSELDAQLTSLYSAQEI